MHVRTMSFSHAIIAQVRVGDGLEASDARRRRRERKVYSGVVRMDPCEEGRATETRHAEAADSIAYRAPRGIRMQ